jgi:putative methyltransferase (TIGR04325 family)
MRHKLKVLLKGLTPPLIWETLRVVSKKNIYFRGIYSTWDAALNDSKGYDSPLILDKVKGSLYKVKKGEAVCERDSVLFDKVQYSFPVLAGLLRIALANEGRLNVLDFGGSLGSSYFQYRGFLSGIKELSWSIVEQKKFVECGKEFFGDDELKFYSSLDECLQFERPQVILLSSVLQYLKEPYILIEELIKNKFQNIIIDRTPFKINGSDMITIQVVPKHIYEASYPSWIFNWDKFSSFFEVKYSLLTDFDAIDGSIKSGRISADYKGCIFELKDV